MNHESGKIWGAIVKGEEDSFFVLPDIEKTDSGLC
jgi:hypothetical protein